jgi:hypothetical protein
VLWAIPYADFKNARQAPANRLVLTALGRIMKRCGKEIFKASVREIALEARLHHDTVNEVLKRLRLLGWVNFEEQANKLEGRTLSLKRANRPNKRL